MKSAHSIRALDVLGAERFAACRDLELREAEIELAWELARLPLALDPEDRRALLLLFLAVLASQASGSTRLPIGEPLERWLARMKSPEGTLTRIRRMLEGSAATDPSTGVIGGSRALRPLIRDGDFLYAQKMLSAENGLVDQLAPRWSGEVASLNEARVNRALEEVRRQAPRVRDRVIDLSDEQLEAVRIATQGRLTVISGGPGTGKTSIVVSIIRVLARLGVRSEDIALAAPTGKAAQRLEHSLSEQMGALGPVRGVDEQLRTRPPTPRTLHRLLGYSPRTGRFRFHEGNLLPERVVIVDECSMIDLALMRSLTRAVAADAQLILLGDADQLPSVEAGAVFRDLVGATEVSPSKSSGIRLNANYRMDPTDPAGRLILLGAQSIKDGSVPPLEASAGELGMRAVESVADLRFEGVELLDLQRSVAPRPAFLERWLDDLIQDLPDFSMVASKPYFLGEQRTTFKDEDASLILGLLAHYDSRRLLCATRGLGRPTGAESINQVLHQHRHDHDRRVDEHAPTRTPELLPGEPIIMTTNDYHRELYNGDQGVVLSVSSKGRTEPMAVFARAGGLVAFPLGALRADLELAYAMTVHKAQGSEFDRVAVVLPDEALPVLSRELLYTALTRSRRSAVIVGSLPVLHAAVLRQDERFCGLEERLRARLADRDGDHSLRPP